MNSSEDNELNLNEPTNYLIKNKKLILSNLISFSLGYVLHFISHDSEH